jgi:transposase IS66 family protein
MPLSSNFGSSANPMHTRLFLSTSYANALNASCGALFVFIAVPGVPAHNNLAERSVRPLVIARKISGGSRSPKGSQTRMGLASIFGTWMAQKLNPFQQCFLALSSKFSLGQV